MTQRYFMKITESNIAEGYVVPKSDLIEVLENGDVRLFSTSADHVEVDSKATAVANRTTKFDPPAELKHQKVLHIYKMLITGGT